MAARIIAIGDVHGCSQALDALIRRIEPTECDLVITLGDYVDRGPETPGVIDQLLKLSQRCSLIPLLGNHEIMLLTALEQPSERNFWLQCGGDTTVDAYGGSIDDIPSEHIDFLNRCQPFHESEDHIFVHANYTAGLPLSEQPQYTLFWEHLSQYVPERHTSGKIAVVGHTPQVNGEILDLEHLLCIDTFCYGGGWLTALDVTTGSYWQANLDGELRAE